MPDVNTSSHALLTMISRCLGGHWAIDPSWLMQHADMIFKQEQSADQKPLWPEMKSTLMHSGGIFSATGEGDKIGKGQALGVINVTGPIYKYGYNSSKNLVSYLNAMASDDRVGGVKLIIDSPGGMVHGTREVYETILNYPKQVLAVGDGYVASAAYEYVAGSSRIVATQPNDQFGSIGTYRTMADWNAFYESMGLKLYEIYADASSEKNEDYREVIESLGKKTGLAQQDITVLNNQFLMDVKAGRGNKLTGKGQDPFKGRLFYPEQAIENGLIDEQVSSADTLGLLADMVATNKQSTIQMGKLEQIMQIISGDDTADNSTVEQLTAQVAILTTERDAATAQVATLTTERDAATAQVATLTTERDTAQASVTTLTTERDEARQLAAEYGAQPGEKPTKVTKTQDEIPKADGETKTAQQIIAALPSELEAEAMGFR